MYIMDTCAWSAGNNHCYGDSCHCLFEYVLSKEENYVFYQLWHIGDSERILSSCKV